jgi:outer membrane lipoprotein-sorting protein
MAAAVLSSCTSSSESMREASITFEELSKRVNASAGKLSSLNAEGEISIDSPTLTNTGSFTVSINRPDSLYTKIEGPFGIDIADVLITRNEFIYYNATENKVIKGPSTQRNLGVILKMKVEFDDLVNALSGNFMIRNMDTSNYKISMLDDKYLLEQKSDRSTQRYFIDSEDFYVTKIQSVDESGKLLLEILYEQFYNSDGVFFPKKITMTRPKEKQYVWVNYVIEDLNPGKLKYRLKIPGSARKIQW